MLRRSMFAAMICITASLMSAAAAETKPQSDVNGLWSDVAGAAFTNAYLVIAQEGSEVRMVHYLEYNGTPMVEYGQGSIRDGKIVFEVKVSKPIPGWATAGTHTLQLSEDGNSLKGEYVDSRANRGPLEFRRLRPAP